MYCGGGKGRWARRACGCGVGEGEACACPNVAAAAARLSTAIARKHFLAARLNSKRDRMAISRIYSAMKKRSEDSGITPGQRQARVSVPVRRARSASVQSQSAFTSAGVGFEPG